MVHQELVRIGLRTLAWVALFAGSVPGQGWETIDRDYWQVRGFDYIPTFRDVAGALGLSGQQAQSVTDVASAVAQWAAYDVTIGGHDTAVESDAQLRRIRSIGANAVRVWLSYHYWKWAGSGVMAAKWDRFLSGCQRAHLYVMPILFDYDFEEPDDTSLAGVDLRNYVQWVRSPSLRELRQATPPFHDGMRRFVAEMVEVKRNHPGPSPVLLWNIMNEPDLGSTDPDLAAFVLAVARFLKAEWPLETTSVSPPIWRQSFAAVALDPDLDVLGTHLYGYFKLDVEGLMTSIPRSPTGPYKPVLVTEAGNPGGGLPYPDVMNLLSKVPWQATGNPLRRDGVGFFLFQACVGNVPRSGYVGTYPNGKSYCPPELGSPHNLESALLDQAKNVGNHPYCKAQGLFYNPAYDTAGIGFVRDATVPSTIQSMVALAARHGVQVTPPPNLQHLASSSQAACHVPQFPCPEGTDRALLSTILDRKPDFANFVDLQFYGLFLRAITESSWNGLYNYYPPVPGVISPAQARILADGYGQLLGTTKPWWFGALPSTFGTTMDDWWHVNRSLFGSIDTSLYP